MFAYPVAANDQDNHGISIDANALALNGGAIHKEGETSTNALLNPMTRSRRGPSQRVNQADAFIVSGGVSVISSPRAATDTYGAGEVIEIQVVFNAAVNATAGTDFVISVSRQEARGAAARQRHGHAGVRLHRTGRGRATATASGSGPRTGRWWATAAGMPRPA